MASLESRRPPKKPEPAKPTNWRAGVAFMAGVGAGGLAVDKAIEHFFAPDGVTDQSGAGSSGQPDTADRSSKNARHRETIQRPTVEAPPPENMTDFSDLHITPQTFLREPDISTLTGSAAAEAQRQLSTMEEVIAKYPEVENRYKALLLNLRVDQDAEVVHVFLEDDPDFDLVANLGTARNPLRGNQEYPTVEMTFRPTGESEIIFRGASGNLPSEPVTAAMTAYVQYDVFMKAYEQLTEASGAQQSDEVGD